MNARAPRPLVLGGDHSVRQLAGCAPAEFQAAIAWFSQQGDAPNQKIHTLFAGLHFQTCAEWLRVLSKEEGSIFPYLVIIRFYNLYQSAVPGCLTEGPPARQKHWQTYHRLARKLTIRSPISTHLWLLSVGVRAHIRFDLAIAIEEAAADFERIHGIALDFAKAEPTIFGQTTSVVFMDAALRFINLHHNAQTGWRRGVLKLYALGLRVLRPFWIFVFQDWRRRAFRDARIAYSIRKMHKSEASRRAISG